MFALFGENQICFVASIWYSMPWRKIARAKTFVRA